MDYLVFHGNLQAYTTDHNLFAYGFQSPLQQQKMRESSSFCLDATHGISKNIDEILYSLIVRNERIGHGWPVAYIATNDNTAAPIVQWLQFLCDKNLMINPKQITIDCSHAEANAIRSTFPLTTQIQFCIFHVAQAWNRQLVEKVKIPDDLPAASRLLRGEMMGALKKILYEENLDQFHHKMLFEKSILIKWIS